VDGCGATAFAPAPKTRVWGGVKATSSDESVTVDFSEAHGWPGVNIDWKPAVAADGTALAADKAESQDVKGGKAVISASYGLRMVLLFVWMFACVKSGLCDVVALVLPLAFVRPVITIAEFFRKKGE
jgi:hypothetical protein